MAFGNEYDITALFPHFLLDYRQETSEDLRWDDRVVSTSGDWSGNLIDFYFTVANRLVVTNSGSFLVDREVAIEGGLSEPRNPALMRIFGQVGVIDRAGSGLSKIFTTWHTMGWERPSLFESHVPGEVRIELPLQGATTVTPTPTTVDNETILALCDELGHVTVALLTKRLGLSARTAQKRLKYLEEQAHQLQHTRNGKSYIYTRSPGA